ncbi:MAG: phosphotransferase [Bacillota bacterium]|nr:phosphotransferase [Bacillota bacterium]
MHDLKFSARFEKIEPISRGWSEDKKYCVSKVDGTKYLLRISPIERYEKRKALFEQLERVAGLGVPMCQPIEFGTCEDGVYTLHSWIDGEDLEAVLPGLPEVEQYELGFASGEILRTIHSIPAPETQEAWDLRCNRMTSMKIEKYRAYSVRFAGDDWVIAYIEQNRQLLTDRPQCFQHGDYYVGNMMLENGQSGESTEQVIFRQSLRIIDFLSCDFGDPWEEFSRIVWSEAVSPHFATGQLKGYFGGDPPLLFFKMLAFYMASNTLSSIYSALPFGPDYLDTILQQNQDVLEWFDQMRNPVPTWYQPGGKQDAAT